MNDNGLDASFVLQRAAKDPLSKWPSWEKAKKRIIPFCMPKHEPKFKISRDSVFFTIGSCFARNLEGHLKKYGLKNITHETPSDLLGGVYGNQYLNKYTPYGIANEIGMALDPKFKRSLSELLITDEKNFYDPFTDLKNVMGTHEEVLKRRENLRAFFSEIQNADVVVITLGQIETWYDSQTEMHYDMPLPRPLIKAHPDRFFLRIPRYSEYLRVMEDAVSLILSSGKEKKIIITTSPVPAGRTYSGRDAMVSYSHTKSLLRTLAQELADNDERVNYFPSYEIVTLSEREKAFTSDLMHVNDGIVARIMQQFFETYIDLESVKLEELRACRIQSNILHSEGRFEEAFELLSKAIRLHENDVVLLRDLAFVSGRVEQPETLISALKNLDTIVHADDRPIDYKDIHHQDENIRRAWELIDAREFAEAAARINTVFALHSDVISNVNHEVCYRNVLMCLEKLRYQIYSNFIDLGKQTATLNSFLRPGQDLELREKLPDLVIKFNAEKFDECESLIRQYLTNYLPELAAPKSQDLRNILINLSHSFLNKDLHSALIQINNAVNPMEALQQKSFFNDEEDGQYKEVV